jgi:hypothetical protein
VDDVVVHVLHVLADGRIVVEREVDDICVVSRIEVGDRVIDVVEKVRIGVDCEQNRARHVVNLRVFDGRNAIGSNAVHSGGLFGILNFAVIDDSPFALVRRIVEKVTAADPAACIIENAVTSSCQL